MKKKIRTSVKAVAFMVALGFVANSVQAQVNLNKLKDKAKDKVGKKDDGSKNSGSSDVKVETTGNESGYDLYMKGNEFYDKGDYKTALAYYEKAEDGGYSDGEMKIKMRECRDKMDPAKQKEEENAMNEANKTMNLLDQMKYKIDPVQDQGMTGSLHSQYVGKIVFSKTEISKDESSDGAFTNLFNLGDDIYSRVYMAKSFTNEGNSIGYISQFTDFHYRMTVAGQSFDMLPTTKIDPTGVEDKGLLEGPWGYPLSKVGDDPQTKDTWTTYQIAISPKAADVKDYPADEYRDFWYRMYQLPAGAHKVKLEVVFDIPKDEVDKGSYGNGPDQGRKWTTKFGTEKVLAVGEFTVNVTEAGKIAAGKKICPQFDWLNYKLIKVPDGFTMVDKTKRAGETVLKVVETDNDWTYQKNGYGVILSRSIRGKALIQDNKSKLCFEVDIVFSQENISSGGSKYAATQFTRDVEFNALGSKPLFLKDCGN